MSLEPHDLQPIGNWVEVAQGGFQDPQSKKARASMPMGVHYILVGEGLEISAGQATLPGPINAPVEDQADLHGYDRGWFASSGLLDVGGGHDEPRPDATN